MEAIYLELNLRDIKYVSPDVIINGVCYTVSQDAIQSLSRIAGTDLSALPNARAIAYVAGTKLVAFFACDDSRFTPDDGLTLHNRLKAEHRHAPFLSVTAERTQMMLFGDVISTNHGDLRVGVFADVPHTGKPVIIYAAIERVLNGSFIILPDKDSTVKTDIINTTDPLDWVYTSLKSSVEHTNTTLVEWIKQRWAQLYDSTASLEECLDVAKKIGNKILSAVDLNELLTAHKLASPTDRWPMYRKQANTPYSRLDLVCMLAEYATTIQADLKFKIMAEAGSMVVQYGDLELRPAWLNWDRIDYSNSSKIL